MKEKRKGMKIRVRERKMREVEAGKERKMEWRNEEWIMWEGINREETMAEVNEN